MKTHTIYRKHNSNDFGSPCVATDGFTGLLEVTMVQHKTGVVYLLVVKM